MPDLPDFDTDAAISADLDGELGAYASELGTDEAALRAAMTERPGIAVRRAELSGARDALRAPTDPLDELTRARLVARALPDGPAVPASTGSRPHHPSRFARVAVAAVVVLVLAIGGVLIAANRGSDGNQSAKSTAGGAVRSGDIGDIGAIDKSKLDQLIGGAPTSPKPEASASTGEAKRADSQASSTDSAVPGFDTGSAAKASPDQVKACRDTYAAEGTVRFSGSGAYHGRSAVVLGLADGKRTIVFVVAADDCATVLFSISR